MEESKWEEGKALIFERSLFIQGDQVQNDSLINTSQLTSCFTNYWLFMWTLLEQKREDKAGGASVANKSLNSDAKKLFFIIATEPQFIL